MKKTAAMFLVLSVLAPFGMRSACAEDVATLGQLRVIEKKQDRILLALEELKNELQIVKIRVSNQ